jgi:hypothetical protein
MWRADVTHDNGRHCEFRPGIRPGPNSPYIRDRKWAAKTARLSALHSLRHFGAGEGIRTLDPNLGKVVLYP